MLRHPRGHGFGVAGPARGCVIGSSHGPRLPRGPRPPRANAGRGPARRHGVELRGGVGGVPLQQRLQQRLLLRTGSASRTASMRQSTACPGYLPTRSRSRLPRRRRRASADGRRRPRRLPTTTSRAPDDASRDGSPHDAASHPDATTTPTPARRTSRRRPTHPARGRRVRPLREHTRVRLGPPLRAALRERPVAVHAHVHDHRPCIESTRCVTVGANQYCVWSDIGRSCVSSSTCNFGCLTTQQYGRGRAPPAATVRTATAARPSGRRSA